MSTQPEALRLADQVAQIRAPYCGAAANELRRLHAQRDELLAALLECERYGGGYTNCNESYLPPTVREKARAAIAKAEAK